LPGSCARAIFPGLVANHDEMTNATLEFALSPDDLPRLAKLPFLTRISRTVAVTTLWHDTPDGALAARCLSLSEQRGHWRLEALRPAPARPWPPGSPAPLIAEGASLASLPHSLGDGLTPIAALRGRRMEFVLRPSSAESIKPEPHPADLHLTAPDPSLGAPPETATTTAEPVRITVLDGQARGVAAEQPACRMLLHGDAALLRPAAIELAGAVRLSVPRAGLAAFAVAVARGGEPLPRHEGPPATMPGLTTSDSVGRLIGQLLDTMLHWAAGAAAGATPVPVHQMRVATRRLRSALAIFKRVAPFPQLVPLSAALRETATRLGAARNWDVFLGDTAERVTAAFPDDARVRALLSAARRRRQAAYIELRAYLASPAFRELEVALACASVLRPWDREGTPDPRLHQDTAVFAGMALAHQLKRVRHAGRDLTALPLAALHELRKDCKRLRYTAEFFVPLFPEKPARRFIKRLAALQEELGLLNDGATAAGLMAHLGRAERSYAAGLVEGFVAAGAVASRAQVGRAWKQFRKTEPFWI